MESCHTMPWMSWFLKRQYFWDPQLDFCSPRSRWICLALGERYMSVWRCHGSSQLKDEHLDILEILEMFFNGCLECVKKKDISNSKKWSLDVYHQAVAATDFRPTAFSSEFFGASQVLGNEWSFGMQVPWRTESPSGSIGSNQFISSGKLT